MNFVELCQMSVQLYYHPNAKEVDQNRSSLNKPMAKRKHQNISKAIYRRH